MSSLAATIFVGRPLGLRRAPRPAFFGCGFAAAEINVLPTAPHMRAEPRP